MNRRCDKVSRLEFVAIQFGVKFIAIYNLWHYVDRVCQRYLHFPYLFRKLCYFAKLFHDFNLFFLLYFVFKVILFYSFYGFTALDRHFINGIIFTKFDWLPPGRRDSVASDRILSLLKLSSGL